MATTALDARERVCRIGTAARWRRRDKGVFDARARVGEFEALFVVLDPEHEVAHVLRVEIAQVAQLEVVRGEECEGVGLQQQSLGDAPAGGDALAVGGATAELRPR